MTILMHDDHSITSDSGGGMDDNESTPKWNLISQNVLNVLYHAKHGEKTG